MRNGKHPMFQKRHYEQIAEICKLLRDSMDDDLHEKQVEHFVEVFKKDNPQFDPERFREAAGA